MGDEEPVILGIHESHKMKSISDVPQLCMACQMCSCHGLLFLVEPCPGGLTKIVKEAPNAE